MGDNRKTSVYHLVGYIRWRKARRLSTNPDQWVEECVAGTNRTLIEHLKQLKEWIEGPELDGDTPATRSKYCSDVRWFYAHHLVPLPRSRLKAKKEETKVTTGPRRRTSSRWCRRCWRRKCACATGQSSSACCREDGRLDAGKVVQTPCLPPAREALQDRGLDAAGRRRSPGQGRSEGRRQTTNSSPSSEGTPWRRSRSG